MDSSVLRFLMRVDLGLENSFGLVSKFSWHSMVSLRRSVSSSNWHLTFRLLWNCGAFSSVLSSQMLFISVNNLLVSSLGCGSCSALPYLVVAGSVSVRLCEYFPREEMNFSLFCLQLLKDSMMDSILRVLSLLILAKPASSTSSLRVVIRSSCSRSLPKVDDAYSMLRSQPVFLSLAVGERQSLGLLRVGAGSDCQSVLMSVSMVSLEYLKDSMYLFLPSASVGGASLLNVLGSWGRWAEGWVGLVSLRVAGCGLVASLLSLSAMFSYFIWYSSIRQIENVQIYSKIKG